MNWWRRRRWLMTLCFYSRVFYGRVCQVDRATNASLQMLSICFHPTMLGMCRARTHPRPNSTNYIFTLETNNWMHFSTLTHRFFSPAGYFAACRAIHKNTKQCRRSDAATSPQMVVCIGISVFNYFDHNDRWVFSILFYILQSPALFMTN